MSKTAAFEYVVGTLAPAEREAFERTLAQDPELQRQVWMWEEHFMALQDDNAKLPPKPQTWAKIEARIQPPRATRPRAPFYWWLSAAVAFMVVLGIALTSLRTVGPNVDYVAVLTTGEGDAMLTALTSGRDRILWLQWEVVAVDADSSLQLWAVSRRDGQIRSLGVFEQNVPAQVALSQADWRLIEDAQELLLTREESGGSPVNEPSSALLARGVCVRLRQENAG